MTILWKDIPGYEGRYQVSNVGEVRSLDCVLTFAASHRRPGYTRSKKGQFLRPGRSAGGHMTVSLGQRNSRCVHELVLIAFVGPRPPKHDCRHLNGNPADNRLENLCWGTRSENNIDAVRHGTRGKLTEADVIDIYARVWAGPRGIGRQLAAEYDVTDAVISAIKHKRQHVYLLA